MIIDKKKTIIVLILIFTIFIIIVSILTDRLPKIGKQPVTIPVLPTIETDIKNYKTPVQTDISQFSGKVSNSVSQVEKDKLSKLLPLSIKDFQTSVNITTNINIFSIDSEPSQIIHLEIYGVNYNLSDASKSNPNAVAFTESFNKIKSILAEKNINLKNLQIVFGNREYIQSTSENWINSFNLLP